MSTETSKGRFPWALTIASALLFVLLVALGVWQVQRLQWKQGLIAAAGTQANRPPVALQYPEYQTLEIDPDGPLPPPPASPVRGRHTGVLQTFTEFQRVAVSCHWPTLRYVELQTIQDGQAGVRIISACRNFLVDRGFIPDTVSARPRHIIPNPPPRGEGRTIIAVARTTPGPGPFALPPENGRFYARDNEAMAITLGTPLPIGKQVLFAITSTDPEFLALQPSAPPAAFSNNHLGYAITWFGLALALAGFYIALLRRKLTPPRGEERPS